ncbi:MAG: hypothetical protein A2289_23660 [Deltaproteobacteria bacterium RIFOXYA12_FULL_58_15]|nr:MAG: hypothetical protein A2289_23660 [Deltaproteobacteria bacterium RIFOXYA12_FULL_58_15]OGR15134.1 MAG: hypothetical protein A2341_06470 [Deltaproteobacteria bacterium RIFOXYB12_FULL_58_9]
MMRTQIQLEEADYERLRKVAQQQRRSIADCIREGIKLVVASGEAQQESLDSIAGKFAPQPDADLKPHDQWWSESMLPNREAR